jgi:ribosomal protein S18 acetylase RimI-like enzyme
MKILKYINFIFLFGLYSINYSMQSNEKKIDSIKYSLEIADAKKENRAIRVRSGEEEIGFIIYFKNRQAGNHWHIQNVKVHEKYQNKGIGSGLFIRCIKDLKQLNIESVDWDAIPQTDYSSKSILQLISWYKHLLESKIQPIISGSYIIKHPSFYETNIVVIFDKMRKK